MIRVPNPKAVKLRHATPISLPQTNAEIVRFFEERRTLLPVSKTTRTPGGQILDWIPTESQCSNGKIATPPPAAARCGASLDPARRQAGFELDDPSIARGPAGTVPIWRRDFSRLHVTTDPEDYPRKRKVDARALSPGTHNALDASPNLPGYYHTTCAQWTTAFGCEAVLNVWSPYTEFSADHTISQIGLQNHDNNNVQSLEAGWQISHDHYGDWQPHLFSYYTTNNYARSGDDKSGFNRDCKGWVQYDARIFPGALILGNSAFGGAQDVLTLKFRLFEGNWWLQAQDVWIGYYPASLFMKAKGVSAALGHHADWIGFWGEVFSSLSDPTLTTTGMGSGNFANEGWSWAAFQSNLKVQTDHGGTMVDSDGTPSAEDRSMYDIQPNMLSGSAWGSYFWFGGPGA